MSNWQDDAGRPPLYYGWTAAGGQGVAVSRAGSTSTTPGTYVEIAAALPFDCEAVEVQIDQNVIGEDRGYYWLAIGTGGSERVIMERIPFNYPDYRGTFPLFLPRGARVAVGVTTNGEDANGIPRFTLRVFPRRAGRPMPPTRWRGVFTGNVWANDPPINMGSLAWGTWTELLASTPWPVRFLAFNAMGRGGGATRQQSGFRFAVGAVASERIVWDAGPNTSAFDGNTNGGTVIVAPVPIIPAGSRIAATATTNLTAGTAIMRMIIGG